MLKKIPIGKKSLVPIFFINCEDSQGWGTQKGCPH
jgi:hypothetical protein